jgi:hypothetical protein
VQIGPIVSAVSGFRLAMARAFVAMQFDLPSNSQQERCELSWLRPVRPWEAENPKLRCS